MPVQHKSEEPSSRSDAAFSLISNEKLLQLYATMVKCRVLDERLCLFAPQGKADGIREPAGREASRVGATIDLLRGDAVVPARWQFLPDLANGALRGRTLKKLGTHVGHRDSRRSAVTDRFEPIVEAAQIRKRARKGRMVLAFAEIGETAEPSWRKALLMAARQKLPVVFVAQGGRGAKLVHGAGKNGMEEHQSRTGVQGLPAIVVDGDDAVAVYRVAYEAIARARRRLGPTLIECEPYLVTAENNGRPRTATRGPAVESTQTADCIAGMELYLRRKGLWVPDARQRIEAEFVEELDAGKPAEELL